MLDRLTTILSDLTPHLQHSDSGTRRLHAYLDRSSASRTLAMVADWSRDAMMPVNADEGIVYVWPVAVAAVAVWLCVSAGPHGNVVVVRSSHAGRMGGYLSAKVFPDGRARASIARMVSMSEAQARQEAERAKQQAADAAAKAAQAAAKAAAKAAKQAGTASGAKSPGGGQASDDDDHDDDNDDDNDNDDDDNDNDDDDDDGDDHKANAANSSAPSTSAAAAAATTTAAPAKKKRRHRRGANPLRFSAYDLTAPPLGPAWAREDCGDDDQRLCSRVAPLPPRARRLRRERTGASSFGVRQDTHHAWMLAARDALWRAWFVRARLHSGQDPSSDTVLTDDLDDLGLAVSGVSSDGFLMPPMALPRGPNEPPLPPIQLPVRMPGEDPYEEYDRRIASGYESPDDGPPPLEPVEAPPPPVKRGVGRPRKPLGVRALRAARARARALAKRAARIKALSVARRAAREASEAAAAMTRQALADAADETDIDSRTVPWMPTHRLVRAWAAYADAATPTCPAGIGGDPWCSAEQAREALSRRAKAKQRAARVQASVDAEALRKVGKYQEAAKLLVRRPPEKPAVTAASYLASVVKRHALLHDSESSMLAARTPSDEAHLVDITGVWLYGTHNTTVIPSLAAKAAADRAAAAAKAAAGAAAAAQGAAAASMTPSARPKRKRAPRVRVCVCVCVCFVCALCVLSCWLSCRLSCWLPGSADRVLSAWVVADAGGIDAGCSPADAAHA